MNMETVFKLAIDKKTDELKDIVNDYIEDAAASSELLTVANELKDLIYFFNEYEDEKVSKAYEQARIEKE